MWQLIAKHTRAYTTDCVGAFVTFNNEESVHRCLDDYHGSGSWLSLAAHWLQPTPLMFRGRHRLTVVKATDPSQVVWENLELTGCQRTLRQTGVNVLLLALLVVSFLFIILANAQQQQFRAAVPTFQFCNVVLPAAMFGRNVTSRFVLDGGSTLPPGLQLQYDAADPTCLPAGRPRMRWTTSNNVAPLTSPLHANPCLDECVDTGHRCPMPLSSPASTATYPQDWVPSCYCVRRLLDTINTKGIFTGISSVARTDGRICVRVAWDFLVFNLFVLVASG